MQAVKDRLRSASAGVERGPDRTHAKAWIAEFCRRRHVRQRFRALLAHHREWLELAALHEREHVGGERKHRIELSAEQVVECSTLAAVRHVSEGGADLAVEPFAGKMCRRADAG